MPKLEYIARQLQKPAENDMAMISLMSSFGALIERQLNEAGVAERLAAEIRQEFKTVGGDLDKTLSASLQTILEKALKASVGAAVKEIMGGVSSEIEGIEKALRAEIKAIPQPKIPKSERVDLSPIVKAVKEAIGEIRIPEMPEIPKPEEHKKEWTFDVVRDNRTGLLKKVIAT